jgi:hypothetical protein
MRKKGLRNISEKQLLLLIRYWANDKMYEDIQTPAVKSTPKKSEASPQKKKPVEKDTEKPAAKKRGPSKDERAAEIASLFKCVGRCMFKVRTVAKHSPLQLRGGCCATKEGGRRGIRQAAWSTQLFGRSYLCIHRGVEFDEPRGIDRSGQAVRRVSIWLSRLKTIDLFSDHVRNCCQQKGNHECVGQYNIRRRRRGSRTEQIEEDRRTGHTSS